MSVRLSQSGEYRLEGLCERTAEDLRRSEDRIRIGRDSDGIERLEAHFAGQAFSPHRHDTYAIGMTLSGVQTFFYRGERRYCLPGQCHILHPDEVHDGGAGTAAGFSYRIVYVDPSLVQQALGGKPLPFVSDPIVRKGVVQDAVLSALWRLDDAMDEVERTDFVTALADMLDSLSGDRAGKQGPLRLASLVRVHDLIAAEPASPLSVERLESVAGLDRWALARQFRAAFGTSPRTFRTMRQLDRARRLMRGGTPLAEAALESGFSDQSHMSRMFKRTYGLTPTQWAAALM